MPPGLMKSFESVEPSVLMRGVTFCLMVLEKLGAGWLPCTSGQAVLRSACSKRLVRESCVTPRARCDSAWREIGLYLLWSTESVLIEFVERLLSRDTVCVSNWYLLGALVILRDAQLRAIVPPAHKF
jgi:hypothetical protein